MVLGTDEIIEEYEKRIADMKAEIDLRIEYFECLPVLHHVNEHILRELRTIRASIAFR